MNLLKRTLREKWRVEFRNSGSPMYDSRVERTVARKEGGMKAG